ncbi:MAG: hypothetical protein WCK65_09680 [Rhodospirillaceae bacterium]
MVRQPIEPPVKIAVINRFYPPDPAPTGRAAQSLVQSLTTELPGCEITVYTTRGVYDRRPTAGQAAAGVSLVTIPALYQGKQPILRLLSSVVEGLRLAYLATRRADLVISLTDPPLLSFWVALFVRRSGCAWIEWVMDVYPDFLVAARVVKPNNPIYLWLWRLACGHRPNRIIALGEPQLAYLHRTRGMATPGFILPAGVLPAGALPEPAPILATSGLVRLAYAGNLGDAHCPELVARLIERATDRGFHFDVSVHGSRAKWLRRRLAGRSMVRWHDFLAQDQLAEADCHLVTLSAAATWLCVPSKAVSAVCMARPVIFAGSADADSWAMLGQTGLLAGWLIAEQANGGFRDADIDNVLAAVAKPQEREAKTAAAKELGDRLRAMEAATQREIAAWIADHIIVPKA